ncbi:MAG TPA: biopolymer transporter ExbD [Acidobacteriota bacterium]|jgi:biopolymer transport protein ExbD|nr:biopolymer transporter ExbD [Acidobacteriota bacterium]MDP6687128.1 biopolymer transporter ExbD [Acidobacteriota bacterium]MEC8944621.1 biopolymer transporter ExbD [Acidobacteriota bacterium]MEE3274207.1 biopolymer transporter ExbD [Acidobacteriota bacterium]HJO29623.1 biopolymer transporter ExbD [Acidobacteriota bacterium]|tara:strand:+ start:2024 stop:2443 length:420 start_codon:yes stop_codon:yes gene_type:complete
MFSDDQSRRRVSLDISPLLDVVFLLLIFFLVTTTFMPDASMELELPESTTATQSEVVPTMVTVGEDGGVQIDGDSVSIQELERAVAALLPEEREKITVRADARVDYGVIVRIIDALRNAGVDALSLPMDTVQGNAGRER